MDVVLQRKRFHCSSQPLDSLWLSNSSPPFLGESGSGSSSMVSLPSGNITKDMPLLTPLLISKEDNGNEDQYEACFHQPEKKRRLTTDQVRFLEKNFEVENKLEPERKVQLAREAGLQPRQVAIWFQNRRARFKNKQLEKDYDHLAAKYEKLKADYESLSKEKEHLKNEVLLLTDKLLPRDKEKANSEPYESTKAKFAIPIKPNNNLNEVSQNSYKVPMVDLKQEEAISAKSDVVDSDCSRYTDGNYSSILEPANSSHVFEPEVHSDLSKEEEENLSRSMMAPLCSPKLEDGGYCIDPTSNSCFLNFPVEDQPSWFWSF